MTAILKPDQWRIDAATAQLDEAREAERAERDLGCGHEQERDDEQGDAGDALHGRVLLAGTTTQRTLARRRGFHRRKPRPPDASLGLVGKACGSRLGGAGPAGGAVGDGDCDDDVAQFQPVERRRHDLGAGSEQQRAI